MWLTKKILAARDFSAASRMACEVGAELAELFQVLLKVGEPWEEIIDAASRLDAGLIVMGTHGRRGLPRAILGSVAEKVVRLSAVPVLTIRDEDTQAHETPTTRPLQ